MNPLYLSEASARERYFGLSTLVTQLEGALHRCGGMTISGEPAYQVLGRRLARAQIDKAEAYGEWRRARDLLPTSRPVRLA